MRVPVYLSSIVCLLLFSTESVEAQGGKGGYAKITALPATNEISLYANGQRYEAVNQEFNVAFKIQGAPGKNRKKTHWTAGIGDQATGNTWSIKVDKGHYSRTINLFDIFDAKKLSRYCNRRLDQEVKKRNTSRKAVLASGWSSSITINIPYTTRMSVRNPLTANTFGSSLYRNGQDSRALLIRCARYDKPKTSKPKKNKKPENKKTRDKPKRDTSKTKVRDTLKRPKRDTLSISNAVPSINSHIATPLRPDLYAVDGGFGSQDDTSWRLLIGNKGKATSLASKVKFNLKIVDQDNVTGHIDIPSIDAGSSFELKLPSILPVKLIDSLTARIDDPSLNEEYDEGNNGFIFIDSRVLPAGRTYLRKRPGRSKYLDSNDSTGAKKMSFATLDTKSEALINCKKINESKFWCGCDKNNVAICDAGLKANNCRYRRATSDQPWECAKDFGDG